MSVGESDAAPLRKCRPKEKMEERRKSSENGMTGISAIEKGKALADSVIGRIYSHSRTDGMESCAGQYLTRW